ncbi:hypothetical protein OCU04_003710 [Sclerotinia nivalis]|uniref:Beta-ketoacyl synthase C-terminal domain-containing protein n=1 Tax=Sclerotinia nivalis TaxID=352851 RepID=A0A9X0ATB3_9HELO|nr:hypothetical protein OCU04_003710 [Sclerotinia nivalis]
MHNNFHITIGIHENHLLVPVLCLLLKWILLQSAASHTLAKAGSVVIKRFEDAEADNDNFLAVVLAAGMDHSSEAESITHPNDLAQIHLFKQMIKRAGIDPLSIGYVEFPGKGIIAGTPREMRSVTSVFANGKPRDTSLYL